MMIRTVIASAALLGATVASAQNLNIGTPECIIGGIAGGILGNQVGKGDGNKAAVAVGSVLGCATGQRVAQPDVIERVPGPHYGYGRHGVPGPYYGGYEGYPSNARTTEQYYNRSYTLRDGRPFAPACFSQWMGTSSGSYAITPQGRQALRNATRALSQSHEASQVALMTYSSASQRLNDAQIDASNPQTRWIVGGAIDARVQDAQRDERKALKQYKDAYEQHNMVIEQTLRACEYSAARGEDVSEFASLLNYMDPLPSPRTR